MQDKYEVKLALEMSFDRARSCLSDALLAMGVPPERLPGDCSPGATRKKPK